MILSLFTALLACNPQDGGECSYADYEGTCTVEEDGSMTFSSIIDGEEMTFSGNDAGDLEIGEVVDCTLSYITEGTCSPCVMDTGDCGDEVYDFMASLH